MAKGRMLNRSIAVSEKMNELGSDSVRLLATWVIPWLDKRGVFHADPRIVRATVFPLRDDLSNAQVGVMLDQMAAVGVIRRFESDGRQWMFWPGFAHNQKGLKAEREATEFPPPPDSVQQLPELVQQLPDNIPQHPPQVQLQLQQELEVQLQQQSEDSASAPPNLDEAARAAGIDRLPSIRSKKAKAAAQKRADDKYDLSGYSENESVKTYLSIFEGVLLPRELAGLIAAGTGIDTGGAWEETCKEWAKGNPTTGKTWNPLAIDKMLTLYRAKRAQARQNGASGSSPTVSKADAALALLRERGHVA